MTTYRPGYSPSWLDKSYATQLALPRLQPHDSRTVVQSVLPAMPDSGPWEQAILDTAGGNPFFLEELAWAVREGGVEQPTSMIPDTVQAVQAARIDRLPSEAKRLLQTAAVIGRHVPMVLLQAIAEVPEDVLQHSLARLQAGEFLYETRPLPDPEFTFKHALTHQVAYNSLLQERQRTLHARIVDTIELLYADRLAEQVERLAHHAWQGEVWEKAVAYLRQAGTKAIASSANREAVAHLERALVALQHLPECRITMEHAIDVRFDLRLALLPLGENGRIYDVLHEAQGCAEALGDQQRLGWVFTLLTHHFWLTRELDRALASGQRALALATPLGDVTLHTMAHFCLGEVYYSLGDYQRATATLRQKVHALESAVKLARFSWPAVGPALQSVASRRWLVLSLAEAGAFAEALTRGEEAIQLAEADGHPYTLTNAYAAIGGLYLLQGNVHKALLFLERGLELCQVWNIHQTRVTFAAALSSALALAGRVPEALALLTQTLSQAPFAQSIERSADALLKVGEVALLAGRLEEATAHAVRALTLSRDRKERGAQAWSLRLLGTIYVCHNPPEVARAEDAYQQALALAKEPGMRPTQAHCHLGLGTLYGQTGQRERARAELAAAIDLYRAMEMTFWLPQAEAALAQVEGRCSVHSIGED